MYMYFGTQCMSHVTLVVPVVGSGIDVEEVNAICRTCENSSADVIIASIVVYFQTEYNNRSFIDVGYLCQPDAEGNDSVVWLVNCFYSVNCCPCCQKAVVVQPFWF